MSVVCILKLQKFNEMFRFSKTVRVIYWLNACQFHEKDLDDFFNLLKSSVKYSWSVERTQTLDTDIIAICLKRCTLFAHTVYTDHNEQLFWQLCSFNAIFQQRAIFHQSEVDMLGQLYCVVAAVVGIQMVPAPELLQPADTSSSLTVLWSVTLVVPQIG